MDHESDEHEVALAPDLSIRLDEAGTGRPALILHGGGGPGTMAPIIGGLAGAMHTITPTHPGWDGTERPDRFSGVEDLAAAYLELLARRELREVLVVGSSVGGWIACELAVRDQAAAITGLVLIDSVGIEVESQPIRDFFALSPREVADYAFHDGDAFYVDPATMAAEQAQTQQANMAALRTFAGDPYMHDPRLRGRLGDVTIPTLAIWGDSDGIVSPDYGRALATAFAHGRFELVADAGHLPHLEQPQATLALIEAFAKETGS